MEYLQRVLGISESKLTYHPYLVPDRSLFCSATGRANTTCVYPAAVLSIRVGKPDRVKGWRHLWGR